MSTPGMIGTIDHYHAGKSFANYIKRFEILCKLNKVTEDTKKDLFISLCGDAVFDEIMLLFPNQDVDKLKYEDIVAKLKLRFDRTEPILMHRYKFYKRSQGPNETGENFVLAINLLAESCNFKTFKDEAIRDHLIFGLYDQTLKKKILLEDDISLEELQKLIINTELAGERVRFLVGEVPNNGEVLSIKHRLGERSSRVVNRGGGQFNRYRSRSRSREWERRGRRENYNGGQDRSMHSTAICNYCKRVGHIRRECWFLNNTRSVKFVKLEQEEEDQNERPVSKFDRLRINDSKDESDVECMMISSLSSLNNISEPCFVEAIVQSRKLSMEIDTGSAVSVISEMLYNNIFRHVPVLTCNKRLMVVNGDKLSVAGRISVEVLLNGFKRKVDLIVLKTGQDFIPLIGRNWLEFFFPDWKNNFANKHEINNLAVDVVPSDIVSQMKNKYSKIFSKDFSEPILGYEADLVFKPEQPIFKRPYQIPYKLKEKFVEHLDMLEKQGVITPVKASEWASPVIAVVKKDDEIRMVIDCKVSLNKILIPNTYPLPLAQDIFASLSGCKFFCSLDLAGAYTQLLLSKRSRKYVVINTLKGLFIYNRLPQGASSSAAVFQQIMEQILGGLDRVCCYLDDVLIAGETYEECLCKLEMVLEKLTIANVRVNFKKCKFFVSSLQYLGHVITQDGLLPAPEKLSTINNAKVPKNVSELKAFLGLINYYNKFIPSLSTKLRCLYGLLKKNVRFDWTDECNEAFINSKNCLLNANILTYYDPKKPLVVVTDASSYGLGGVLTQVENDVEKPVCFTSFSLNSAQRKYPILHLEALALVCVIKKFHKFLFGQKFKVFTDHKPLLGIFGKEGRHSIYVTRLQRYVLELSIYDFDIEYRPASKLGNADFCSRFPIEQKVPSKFDYECVNSLNYSDELPLDFNIISTETKTDNILIEIIHFLDKGWPSNIPKQFKNLYSQKESLQFVEGVLLLENRVIIPDKLRKAVLKLLHINHSGMVKMKQLARKTVYWEGMNKQIEDYVKSCNSCAQMEIIKKPEHLGSWLPTNRPFSRLHADFFYFEGKTFLLIVDSFSKWLEIEYMRFGTTAKLVNRKFAATFARFGLPDVVVTDGGPPFNSNEFITFLKSHGINVMKSPPYNPASNGQAERMVRVVKEVFKKFLLDDQTKSLEIEDRLNLFLINYRNSCLSAEGMYPSERIFAYQPKMLLDLINPNKSYKNFIDKTPERIVIPDKGESFEPDLFDKLVTGDKLFYKNNKLKHDFPNWLEAIFIKKLSTNVFQISLRGHVLTAHRHQLKMVHVPQHKSKVMFTFGSNKRKRDSLDEEDEFRGFAEQQILPDTSHQHVKKARSESFKRTIVTRSMRRNCLDTEKN